MGNLDELAWYEAIIITPWAKLTGTDDLGRPYVTDPVNGTRASLAAYRYGLRRCSDVSHQPTENIAPTPNLCTIWAVMRGSVLSEIIDIDDGGDMLVLEYDVTARLGWITEAQDREEALKIMASYDKPVEKKDKPGKVGPDDTADKVKKDKLAAWMAKHGVPSSACDAAKANKWGEITGPLCVYVRQLTKG